MNIDLFELVKQLKENPNIKISVLGDYITYILNAADALNIELECAPTYYDILSNKFVYEVRSKR